VSCEPWAEIPGKYERIHGIGEALSKGSSQFTEIARFPVYGSLSATDAIYLRSRADTLQRMPSVAADDTFGEIKNDGAGETLIWVK
jgi:hypothetical protein